MDFLTEDFLDELDLLNSKATLNPIDRVLKGLEYLKKKGCQFTGAIHDEFYAYSIDINTYTKSDFEIMYSYGWYWNSETETFTLYV